MKHIRIVLFIFMLITLFQVNNVHALEIVQSNNAHSTIPLNYHFAPRFIENKTTIELCNLNNQMKWSNEDGYYQLQNKSSKAIMPSDEFKGKIYVIYHQVGYFNEQAVDMKITLMDWSDDCKRIEFGKKYIGFGNASGSSGGLNEYISVKIEYFYANTNRLFQGLKGHQPVGDLDYFITSNQSEWIQLKSNYSSEIIVPMNNYNAFDYSRLSKNMIGSLKGHGGTNNTDGLNFVYLFTSPSHSITWYGGFLRMNMNCPDQEFQINYYGNNSAGNMSSQVVNYGVETKLNKNIFSKLGYHFNGWHVYRDYDDSWACVGETYWKSGELTCEQYNHYKDQAIVSKTAPCGNVYMYACFKPNTYNIVFDSNGGIGKMESQTFKYDQSSKLNKNTFTKDGYDFIGWSTSKDGKVIYQDEQVITNLTSDDHKQITLYALWQKKQYVNTVNHLFNVNDSYINGKTTSFNAFYNQQYSLEDYILDLPNGYQVDKYFQSGSIDQDWLSYSIKQLITQKPHNMAFYLSYSPVDYKITYELNGGINHQDNPDTYNVLEHIQLLEPKRDGCEFLGWYLNGELITGINNSIKSFDSYETMLQQLSDSLSGNIVLEAKWKSVPSIHTKTNYYYLNDEVTLDELLLNASAFDTIDQDLSSKLKIEKIVYPSYKELNPSKLDTSKLGIVYITYSVMNSLQIETQEVGVIYIVDREVSLSNENLYVYPRFISDDKCSDGLNPIDTLNEYSIWLYSDYYEMLMNSLSREGEDYLHEYDYINER